MKVIHVGVYRSASGTDCTGGGVSSKFDDILLPHERGPFEIDENNPPENLCKVVTRFINGRNYLHIEPMKSIPKGYTDYSFGGNLASSSDARYHELCGDYALDIHDRIDTWEDYDRMSR